MQNQCSHCYLRGFRSVRGVIEPTAMPSRRVESRSGLNSGQTPANLLAHSRDGTLDQFVIRTRSLSSLLLFLDPALCPDRSYLFSR